MKENFKTLENMFQLRDKFCFLVGSGISLDPPSCLPAGFNFMEELLEQIFPKEVQNDIPKLIDSRVKQKDNVADFLRFEQLVEMMQDYDPDLRVMDIYSACKVPNFNHRFLSRMLILGHQVFTTNFDNLIEIALLENNVPKQKINPVIYKADWRKKKRHNMYYIYKLHGSLVDTRTGQDARDSLQTTLSQITRKKGEFFQLEPWKQRVLKRVLQNYDLIVLGYSGLDDFDIMPTLWTISSPKRIAWINHEDNRSINKAQIEIVQDDSFQSSNLDRLNQNLLYFVQYQTREPTQLIRISVNSGQFLTWLWQRYIDERIPKENVNPCSRIKITLPNTLASSKVARYFLAAQIMAERHWYEKSLQLSRTALRLSQKQTNPKQHARLLTLIGSVLFVQGKVTKSLQHYQEARAIAEKLKDRSIKKDVLTKLGILFKNQGRLNEALQCYHAALTINEELDDFWGKSSNLMYIGNILTNQGRLKEAFHHYQQALNIANQLGDSLRKSECFQNMGNVFFRKNEYKTSFEYYQKALAIDTKLGHKSGIVVHLICIGTVFQATKEFSKALKYYQEALLIAKQLNDLRSQSIAISNIGTIHHTRGQLDKALKYYQEALTIDEGLDDILGIAYRLVNIGSILHSQRRLKDALLKYQRALEIAEHLKDAKLINEIQGRRNSILRQLQ